MADDMVCSIQGLIDPKAWEAIGEGVKQDLVRTLATVAKRQWIKQAQDSLKTFRASYIKAIADPEIDENMATVVLTGAVANRVERGYEAYDMHDTLLGDRVPVLEKGQKGRGKRKRKGGGFYRAIPFRHATPGTLGEVGTAFGDAYSGALGAEAAADLGKKVYEMAKKLSVSTEGAGGRTNWGNALPAGLAPKLKPHHATDIYAGAYKVEKEYSEDVKQNQYKTFRTISTNSPGWRVAAQPGKHLVVKVKEHIDSIAQDTLDAIMARFNESSST